MREKSHRNRKNLHIRNIFQLTLGVQTVALAVSN